jgi:hypothetical protein
LLHRTAPRAWSSLTPRRFSSRMGGRFAKEVSKLLTSEELRRALQLRVRESARRRFDQKPCMPNSQTL